MVFPLLRAKKMKPYDRNVMKIYINIQQSIGKCAKTRGRAIRHATRRSVYSAKSIAPILL